ncbi:MAG: hypothetical protein WBA41_03385 [Rivularia sp. (in: cyanobacteria)]
MKVLHVIPSLSPFLGGPTTVVINLVKALLNNGVEAEIVTTNHDGSKPLDVPLYKKNRVPTGSCLVFTLLFATHERVYLFSCFD